LFVYFESNENTSVKTSEATGNNGSQRNPARQSLVITLSISEAASSTMRRSGVVKEVEKMQVMKFKREMKLFRLLLTFPLSG